MMFFYHIRKFTHIISIKKIIIKIFKKSKLSLFQNECYILTINFDYWSNVVILNQQKLNKWKVVFVVQDYNAFLQTNQQK